MLGQICGTWTQSDLSQRQTMKIALAVNDTTTIQNHDILHVEGGGSSKQQFLMQKLHCCMEI